MDKKAIYQATVDFVRVTGELMKRAQAAEEERKKQAAELARVIPEAVKAAVDNDKILNDEQDKVAEALKDPVKAVTLLRDVCRHRPEKRAADTIGKPVGPGSTTQPHVRGAKTASWDDTPQGARFREQIMGI